MNESSPWRADLSHAAVRVTACALGLLPSICYATTLDTDGSAADAQAKIDSAANGDVVLLPSSGAFTWSADVILPSSKAITLDLNGRTVTIDGADNELSIDSSDAGLGGVNRITNGAITRGAGHDPYGGTFAIRDSRDGTGLRVDHITFTGSDVLVDIHGQGAGVMDSCVFTGLSWAQEFIHVVGFGAASTTGWTTDSGSTLAGSGNLFYIEDCTFTQNTSSAGVAWIQGYYGCRIGIRHNSFDWVSVDMHGTAGNIGARWWECYENQFDNDAASGQPSWAFSMRAGSGVIFDNTMAPGSGHAVSTGLCEEDPGYPADYQIGRGLNQELDPAYYWNNSTLSLSVDACDAPEQVAMVQLDRDVFASARPGYTPYSYPHPLRLGPTGEGGAGAGGSQASGGGGAGAGAAGGAAAGGGSPADADAGEGCDCEVPARSTRGSPAWVFALGLTLVSLRRRLVTRS